MSLYRPAVVALTKPSMEHMQQMGAYVEKAFVAGLLADTGGLDPGGIGVRVRRRRGEVTVIEAPLPAATGGISAYAVIAAPDLSKAIEHAKSFLAVGGDGETEVRPMFGMPGAPQQYLMLYRVDGPERTTPPSADEMSRMGAYVSAQKQAGVLVTANGLTPTARGARVQLSKGTVTVVDGPFAEAKELVAGYAVLIQPSLQGAIAAATEFLHLAGDGISEIRPLH